MSIRRYVTGAVLAGALFSVTTRGFAQATQTSSSRIGNEHLESREQLQQRLEIAQRLHKGPEEKMLRERLEHGDFQEGDRIVVLVNADPKVTPKADTMKVMRGRIVQFSPWGDLNLDGVLRSELQDNVLKFMKKFYVNPFVEARSLIRLQIRGNVVRQNYGAYYPPDMLLADVITNAGPGQDLDPTKRTEIRVNRGTNMIWAPDEVTKALADGLSIDQLHLIDGDEIYVAPKKPPRQWLTYLQVGLGLLALVISIDRARR